MQIIVDYEQPLQELIKGRWVRYQEEKWLPVSCTGQVSFDSNRVVLTPTPVNRNSSEMREPSVSSSSMIVALRKGLAGHTEGDLFLLNSLIRRTAIVALDFPVPDHYKFIFFPDAITQQENPIFYKEKDTWMTRENKRVLIPGKQTSRPAFNRIIHGLRRTGERSRNWVLYSFTFQRQDEFIGCFGEDCSWAFIGP